MIVTPKALGMIALCVTCALGCARPPAVEKMTPVVAPDSFPRTNKVLRIGAVTGGEDTKSMKLPTIGNRELAEAIVRTFQAASIFGRVDTTAAGHYELTADIISQETAGTFTLTTALSVAYTLKETATNRVIFTENILTTFRAGVGDAFYGPARVKLVKEGVVRDNLRTLLSRVSEAVARVPVADPNAGPPPA